MERVQLYKSLILPCVIGILTLSLCTVALAADKGERSSTARNEALLKALDEADEAGQAKLGGQAQVKGVGLQTAMPEDDAADIGSLPLDDEGQMPAGEQREPGAGGYFTLGDCVELALRRNERLKAIGYEMEAAKGQLTEASAQFWPVMEYTYRMAPVPTNVDNALREFFKGNVTLFQSVHMGIGFPVMSFGQLSSAKKMAKGGVEAARQSGLKVRESTIYQIKQLYYGILFAGETIKLLGDAIGQINNRLAENEAAEEKEIDPYDIQQLRLFRVEVERRLSEAKDNLELAHEGLKIQMDLDPTAEVKLDTDNLRPVLVSVGKEEDYIDHSMEHMPEIKLLDVGVEVKKNQYRLEKFKLLPRAGFGFFIDIGRSVGAISGLKLTDDFNNPFNYSRAGLGLEFKGNLDFHGAYGRIKKARAEYYKATYDRLIARRALALEVRRSYLQAKRMEDDVRRAKKAESMARQMVFTSKMNIDLGIGDNQKYGDALKMLLLTRGLYFKAVFDYNVALADLAQRITLTRYEEITKALDAQEYDAFDYEEIERQGFETFEEGRATMEGIKYETGEIEP